MEVIIRPTKHDAIRLAAQLIARELKSKPHFVLGLATGATMEGVYDELARMHREEHLDFSRCHTFNLDEYVGVPPDSPFSYHEYMRQHLFSRVTSIRSARICPTAWRRTSAPSAGTTST